MKETRELVMLGVAILNGTGEALEDGEFTALDMRHYVPVLSRIGAAVNGASAALGEIAKAKPEEWAALLAEVRDKFDIPQDQVELKVELALEAAMAIAEAYAKWPKGGGQGGGKAA